MFVSKNRLALRLALVALLPALLITLTLAVPVHGAPASTTLSATAFDFGSSYSALVVTPPAPGWEQPGFDDSLWPVLQAPFANDGFCGFPLANTDWPEFTTVAARKDFSLSAGAHTLHIVGTIDNQVTIWVNGNFVDEVFDGDCGMDGIDVIVPNSFLNPGGDNVVAALAIDHEAVTFFDIKATYNYETPSNANDCKQDGWMNLSRADGSPFKNQGDCVSYTQTGK